MNDIMSKKYREYWNADELARIDEDIEKNRKSDASVKLESTAPDREVKVEQISHDFVFGAHIFNFDQLGTDERNEKYKALYGALFNSATIAFYWKTLEMEEGKPRFDPEYRDSAEFWNNCENPNAQPHWRRPAVEPVVQFCEDKGIRLHGHTLTWGNFKWQIPIWLIDKMPEKYRSKVLPNGEFVDSLSSDVFDSLTPEEIQKTMPDYIGKLNEQMAKRIAGIAVRYGKCFHSWDVVNESASDFRDGRMIQDDYVTKSGYGLMPGDYTYRSFKIAEAFFPKTAKLNINDWNLNRCYAEQVEDLRARGCKIDVMGLQMHLFEPERCLAIANGETDVQSPNFVRNMMDCVHVPGVPTHLSEITITSPLPGPRGEEIQAEIAGNLYKLWFSLSPMMGITWWNVVDGCGAPGEPSFPGLFTRDMQPKQAYHKLNELINKEWRTNLTVKTGANGSIAFRGFRGKYKLSWIDDAGARRTSEIHV